MAIPRKPRDEDTNQLEKSDSTASARREPLKDVRFSLCIPGPMCQELDQLRATRPIKTSRHKWVLEAIYEKIQREKGRE